jgi:hypothetical protein
MVDRNWNNIEKCSILYDLSPIKMIIRDFIAKTMLKVKIIISVGL